MVALAFGICCVSMYCVMAVCNSRPPHLGVADTMAPGEHRVAVFSDAYAFKRLTCSVQT